MNEKLQLLALLFTDLETNIKLHGCKRDYKYSGFDGFVNKVYGRRAIKCKIDLLHQELYALEKLIDEEWGKDNA